MLLRSTGLFLYLTMFVLLISGCGDDGADSNGPPNIDDSMGALNRAADSFTDQYCQCHADQLYSGDIATCREAEESDGMELNSGCERNVAECYATEFRQFTSCLSMAFSDLEACYASCPETQQHVDHCTSEFEDDSDNCVLDLPTGFSVGLSTCEDGDEFVCPE